MHHDHAHHTDDDLEEALKRRVVVAHQSGVPAEAVQRWIERRRGQGTGQAGALRIDRELTEGDTVDTDLGAWRVIYTPGHAPSHICLYQPERRLLISGDHLLGRVSLYFDTGYTPDPVAEFLDSLGKVENLDARLVLSGHGRPFTDVAGHVTANRSLIDQRLTAVREALPGTAYEIAQRVYGERFNELTATWLLTKTLAWLSHLERGGLAERAGEAPERWSIAA
jgi:glyoxylase-like metal-dependent hydrolase (beta-lactamase superfamily II)